MAADLTHRPGLLYLASLERMESARTALASRHFVLAVYLPGLAVECSLQAIALLDNPAHEARHDLRKWLALCRSSLQRAIDSEPVRAHWNHLVAVWKNHIRYLPVSALVGYFRDIGLGRGISGGPDAILRRNAERLLDAATVVHAKSVAAWQTYTKK